MFAFKKQRPRSTFSQRLPADGSPAASQLAHRQQKKKRPEMLREQRDGHRCSEETNVELRRELEETKRELQRLKRLKEKPLSPSDAETLGTGKTEEEMFKVGPQTELLHASHSGGNQQYDAKILSFIERVATLERELDMLLKEQCIILSRLKERQTPLQSSEATAIDEVVKRKTKAMSNQKYHTWKTGRSKKKQQADELQKELGSKKVKRLRRQEKTRVPERDETLSFWKKFCRFFGRNRSKTRRD